MLSPQPPSHSRGCVSPEPALLDGWPMKQALALQATWAPASHNRGNSWCSQTPSTPKRAAPVWPCQPWAPSGHRPGQEQGGTIFIRAAVPSRVLWYLSPRQNSQGFRPQALHSQRGRDGGQGAFAALPSPVQLVMLQPLKPLPPRALIQQLAITYPLCARHYCGCWGDRGGTEQTKNPALWSLPSGSGRVGETQTEK